MGKLERVLSSSNDRKPLTLIFTLNNVLLTPFSSFETRGACMHSVHIFSIETRAWKLEVQVGSNYSIFMVPSL